jgi:hypothetical protein
MKAAVAARSRVRAEQAHDSVELPTPCGRSIPAKSLVPRKK